MSNSIPNNHLPIDKKPQDHSIGSENSSAQQSGIPPVMITNNDNFPDENTVDESTPLILSPDDPRVSPMNDSKVRLLRTTLHILVIVNLVWLVMSLISYFVSIPLFDSHGKSFFEFNFIFLALFVNFMSYAFYLVPNDLQINDYIDISCLLLVLFDFLIIAIFHRTLIGVLEYLSMVFCLLSISINLVSNRFVSFMKAEEETRLTGRVEDRKTFMEYMKISTEVAMKMLLLFYVIFCSMNILLKSIDYAFVKPWGKIINVDIIDNNVFGVHLYCQGVNQYDQSTVNNENEVSKQPILLLEASHGSSEDFVKWVEELHFLNKVDRFCIYDRPGYGFSDSAPSPYSLAINAEILEFVLNSENLTDGNQKFMLVSHGIGGLYSRVFASRNPDMIDSMILVDCYSEEMLLNNPFKNSKNTDVKLPSDIDVLNRRFGFRVWLDGVFSMVNLRFFYDILFHGSWRSINRVYGYDMKYQGKYLRARLQEQVVAQSLSYNDVLLSNNIIKNSDISISVISSKYSIKESLNWGNWQRTLTKLTSSSDSRDEWIISEAGHYIWKTPQGKKDLQNLVLRVLGIDPEF